jgi:DNA-binding beta-propeller fold protein YncE
MRSTGRNRFGGWGILAAALALALVCSSALAPASAEAAPPQLWQKCDSDELAGQTCNFPRGIAADPETGNVYVADQNNHRIVEFDVWGVFLRSLGWDVVATGPGDDTVAPEDQFEVCVPAEGDVCKGGIEGSAAGQLKSPQGLALDSTGDLYVVDFSNRRVQKLDLSGPDPAFEWMVGGGVNQGPNNPGNLCMAVHVAGGDTCGAGSQGTDDGQFGMWRVGSFIAIGTNDTTTSADDAVYVGDENRIQKFDSDGNYISAGEVAFTGAPLPEPGTVTALAVDSASGDLYFSYRLVLSSNQPVQPGVHRLDPDTGEVLDTLDVPTPTAVATAASGHVYAFQNGNNSTSPPPHYKRAILEFDAAGEQVDYFETAPEGFTDASTGLATSSACGIPSTQLYVSNPSSSTAFLRAYGPPATDLDACPPPLAAPSIVDSFASGVGTEGATARAKINPHFWNDATYRIEYGSEGPCSDPGNACVEQPAAPGTQLTTQVVDAALDAGVELTDLDPATTYHYRFVSQSSGGGPTFGPDKAFTTFPEPNPNAACPNQPFRTELPSAHLPDCRAYELVSPLDKSGGDVGTNEPFEYQPLAVYQAAPDGKRVTYGSYTAFGEPESAPLYSQLLSERDPEAGWSTHSISPPRTSVPIYAPLSWANQQQFKTFSADLCQGWFIQDSDLALVGGAPPGVGGLYRRDDQGCGPKGYELLTTEPPPGMGPSEEPLGNRNYVPTIQGVTANAGQTLFRANAALTDDACTQAGKASAPLTVPQLYLHTSQGGESDGDLRLVNRLPDGSVSCAEVSAGIRQEPEDGSPRLDSVHNALSADGARVYWTAASGESSPFLGERGPLYLRVNPAQPQSPISAGACTDSALACTFEVSAAADTRFEGATPSGSHALYTTGGSLHEYDAVADASEEIAAGVEGVMGYSTDLSRVYFVSSENLTGAQQNSEGDAASAGEHNLYLRQRDGDTLFIAGFSERDVDNSTNSFNPPSPIATLPDRRSSRVSPDGTVAAFASAAAITGADSTDAVNSEADTQVFLYEADSGGGAGGLLCASCNPSGARPVGGDVGNSTPFWASATIPGWQTQFGPTRALSEDGERLFFESFDALLPQDTNGRRDVYQWSAPGTGDCDTDNATPGPLFFEPNQGCLSLISSGNVDEAAYFFDASADGSDVFFADAADLVPPDSELIDVYDARIGGGFPAPDPLAPPCDLNAGACEGQASADPPAQGAGSASFAGPGNPPSARKACPKGKRRVTRKGKARCVPRKRVQRNRKRNAEHDRRATR